MERLTIGELAKHARVNLETIRYYERQELLPKPPRLQSGYRAFPEESEIKELLSLQTEPHSSGADVRKRVEAKIADVEEKMKALRAIKKGLVQLKATCTGESSIGDCPILKSLNSERE
jgi:MerR family transcriptional regulator, copper efflux regulator